MTVWLHDFSIIVIIIVIIVSVMMTNAPRSVDDREREKEKERFAPLHFPQSRVPSLPPSLSPQVES